jgi:hypothetical protein
MPAADPSPDQVFGWLRGLVGSVAEGIGEVVTATQNPDGSATLTNASGQSVTVTRETAPAWLPYAAGGAALLILVLAVKR